MSSAQCSPLFWGVVPIFWGGSVLHQTAEGHWVTVWVASVEARRGTVRPRKALRLLLEGQGQTLQALGTRAGLGSLLIPKMFWSPALSDSVQSHPQSLLT